MIIEIYHHKCFVKNISQSDYALVDIIRENCKVFEQNFQFNKFMPPTWTVTSLYDTVENSFPAGYIDHVKQILKNQKADVRFIDRRIYPKPTLSLRKKSDIEPWGHQQEAIDAIKKNETGIISLVTAGGKSLIIQEAILCRRVKTLIIVPTVNIQNQIKRSCDEFFGVGKASTVVPKEFRLTEEDKIKEERAKIDKSFKAKEEEEKPKNSLFAEIYKRVEPKKIGIDFTELNKISKTPEEKFLQDKTLKREAQREKKKKETKIPDITILCFSSLEHISKEYLEKMESLIVDECHHSAAVSIREALLKLKNAAYRYYLSGTPWRDKHAELKLLESAMGNKVIFEKGGKDAVDEGIIAKPELVVLNSEAPEKFLRDIKDWRTIVDFGIVGNTKRNGLIVKKALEYLDEGKNVFIALDEIAHLLILEERFKTDGVEAITIHGEKPHQENKKNIKIVGERESGISIGTMSVGEGADMPNIDVVILASGGKGSIRFLQRIGRGARKGSKNKQKFIVVDFFDWFNPTLIKHSQQRQRIFNDYFIKGKL